MQKKYIVRLSEEARCELHEVINTLNDHAENQIIQCLFITLGIAYACTL